MRPNWVETPLERLFFVALDVETTGLRFQEGHRVCEVGAVLYGPSGLLAAFHSLVNPEREVPEEAQRVHRIPPERLREAPAFREVASLLVQFLDAYPVLAYNANFDVGFLNFELTRHGLPPLANPVVDVLELARRLNVMEASTGYQLERVARKMGVSYENRRSHRALYDAQVTAQVFRRMGPLLVQRGFHTLKELLRWLSADTAVVLQMVQVFTDAQLEHRWVRIRYRSMDNTVSDRVVLPLQIERRNEEYFLTAYDLMRRDRRTFRLRQVEAWALMETAPTPSPGHDEIYGPES